MHTTLIGYGLAVVFLGTAFGYRFLFKQSEGYAQGLFDAYHLLLNHPPSMLTDLQLLALARILQNTQIALQTKEN